MAADGLRTGRSPGFEAGVSELTGVDAGVKSKLVSASGAGAGDADSEVAVHKENRNYHQDMTLNWSVIKVIEL